MTQRKVAARALQCIRLRGQQHSKTWQRCKQQACLATCMQADASSAVRLAGAVFEAGGV